jgi:hypothetical protein
MVPGSRISDRIKRTQQVKELAVLSLIYLLQITNAEMLRRASGLLSRQHAGSQSTSLVESYSLLLANHVHPVAMGVFGIWLTLMALLLARVQTLPRWSFDIPGIWFCLRLALEFVTISTLIFEKTTGLSDVAGVVLGQIVVYLPYFVITWGWLFHRVDLIGQPEPGQVVRLVDANTDRGITSFDYYHSAITTLIDKGKPTIAGVGQRGRMLVLAYKVMVVGLYAVAFARILQLTRSVF